MLLSIKDKFESLTLDWILRNLLTVTDSYWEELTQNAALVIIRAGLG